MPNVYIDQEKLHAIIEQIEHDVSLQHSILEQLIDQLPDNWVDAWIKDKFYNRIETRPYYLVEHTRFKQYKEYCRTLKEVVDYISNWHGDSKDLNTHNVSVKVKSGRPLLGFTITRINNKGDD